MQTVIDRPGFWFLLALAMAAAVLYAEHIGDPVAAGIMLLNTMLASANFGAKCVRRELAH